MSPIRAVQNAATVGPRTDCVRDLDPRSGDRPVLARLFESGRSQGLARGGAGRDRQTNA
jgi:hypothetical protein